MKVDDQSQPVLSLITNSLFLVVTRHCVSPATSRDRQAVLWRRRDMRKQIKSLNL